MSVLSVYVAGVPTTGIEIISKAVNETFGECNVVIIDRDKLRYNVRLGFKDSSVVLMILDSTSMDECSDIVDDSLNTDKFYKYIDDKSLTLYLNDLYDIKMDIPEEDDTDLSSYQIFESQGSDDVLREMYDSQLRDRDAIISNLGARVQELESILNNLGMLDDNSGNSDLNDKISELSEENLSLRSSISDKDAKIQENSRVISQKESEIISLNSQLEELNMSIIKLKSNIKSMSEELDKERVLSSKKSGSIRDKDSQISALSSRISYLDGVADENKRLSSEVENLSSKLNKLESIIANLKVTVQSKEKEIARLSKELKESGVSSSTLEEYKKLLDGANNEYDSLVNEYNDIKSDYEDLLSSYNTLKPKYDDLVKKYNKLVEDYKESEGFVTKLNNEKLALTARLSYLESNTDANVSADADSVISELNELRKKYAEVQGSIFNAISVRSLPRSGVKVPIFKGLPEKYKNIKFQFSGSIESRKGTYKCLFNECVSSKNDRFLIVDITSETCIDYVFQMSSIVDGLEWFSSGGGVQKYISSTCLPNVKVLIPKIGYLNDSYFLTLNWESRLNELENSGYKVVLYCGDISNLVGRVLFESFSDVGYTSIYVKGNAIGSRSIVANSGGLSGIKTGSVGYFDFDKNMIKFYNIMSKKCKCRVISYAK